MQEALRRAQFTDMLAQLPAGLDWMLTRLLLPLTMRQRTRLPRPSTAPAVNSQFSSSLIACPPVRDVHQLVFLENGRFVATGYFQFLSISRGPGCCCASVLLIWSNWGDSTGMSALIR